VIKLLEVVNAFNKVEDLSEKVKTSLEIAKRIHRVQLARRYGVSPSTFR